MDNQNNSKKKQTTAPPTKNSRQSSITKMDQLNNESKQSCKSGMKTVKQIVSSSSTVGAKLLKNECNHNSNPCTPPMDEIEVNSDNTISYLKTMEDSYIAIKEASTTHIKSASKKMATIENCKLDTKTEEAKNDQSKSETNTHNCSPEIEQVEYCSSMPVINPIEVNKSSTTDIIESTPETDHSVFEPKQNKSSWRDFLKWKRKISKDKKCNIIPINISENIDTTSQQISTACANEHSSRYDSSKYIQKVPEDMDTASLNNLYNNSDRKHIQKVEEPLKTSPSKNYKKMLHKSERIAADISMRLCGKGDKDSNDPEQGNNFWLNRNKGTLICLPKPLLEKEKKFNLKKMAEDPKAKASLPSVSPFCCKSNNTNNKYKENVYDRKASCTGAEYSNSKIASGRGEFFENEEVSPKTPPKPEGCALSMRENKENNIVHNEFNKCENQNKVCSTVQSQVPVRKDPKPEPYNRSKMKQFFDAECQSFGIYAFASNSEKGNFEMSITGKNTENNIIIEEKKEYGNKQETISTIINKAAIRRDYTPDPNFKTENKAYENFTPQQNTQNATVPKIDKEENKILNKQKPESDHLNAFFSAASYTGTIYTNQKPESYYFCKVKEMFNSSMNSNETACTSSSVQKPKPCACSTVVEENNATNNVNKQEEKYDLNDLFTTVPYTGAVYRDHKPYPYYVDKSKENFETNNISNNDCTSSQKQCADSIENKNEECEENEESSKINTEETECDDLSDIFSVVPYFGSVYRDYKPDPNYCLKMKEMLEKKSENTCTSTSSLSTDRSVFSINIGEGNENECACEQESETDNMNTTSNTSQQSELDESDNCKDEAYWRRFIDWQTGVIKPIAEICYTCPMCGKRILAETQKSNDSNNESTNNSNNESCASSCTNSEQSLCESQTDFEQQTTECNNDNKECIDDDSDEEKYIDSEECDDKADSDLPEQLHKCCSKECPCSNDEDSTANYRTPVSNSSHQIYSNNYQQIHVCFSSQQPLEYDLNNETSTTFINKYDKFGNRNDEPISSMAKSTECVNNRITSSPPSRKVSEQSLHEFYFNKTPHTNECDCCHKHEYENNSAEDFHSQKGTTSSPTRAYNSGNQFEKQCCPCNCFHRKFELTNFRDSSLYKNRYSEESLYEDQRHLSQHEHQCFCSQRNPFNYRHKADSKYNENLIQDKICYCPKCKFENMNTSYFNENYKDDPFSESNWDQNLHKNKMGFTNSLPKKCYCQKCKFETMSKLQHIQRYGTNDLTSDSNREPHFHEYDIASNGIPKKCFCQKCKYDNLHNVHGNKPYARVFDKTESRHFQDKFNGTPKKCYCQMCEYEYMNNLHNDRHYNSNHRIPCINTDQDYGENISFEQNSMKCYCRKCMNESKNNTHNNHQYYSSNDKCRNIQNLNRNRISFDGISTKCYCQKCKQANINNYHNIQQYQTMDRISNGNSFENFSKNMDFSRTHKKCCCEKCKFENMNNFHNVQCKNINGISVATSVQNLNENNIGFNGPNKICFCRKCEHEEMYKSQNIPEYQEIDRNYDANSCQNLNENKNGLNGSNKKDFCQICQFEKMNNPQDIRQYQDMDRNFDASSGQNPNENKNVLNESNKKDLCQICQFEKMNNPQDIRHYQEMDRNFDASSCQKPNENKNGLNESNNIVFCQICKFEKMNNTQDIRQYQEMDRNFDASSCQNPNENKNVWNGSIKKDFCEICKLEKMNNSQNIQQYQEVDRNFNTSSYQNPNEIKNGLNEFNKKDFCQICKLEKINNPQDIRQNKKMDRNFDACSCQTPKESKYGFNGSNKRGFSKVREYENMDNCQDMQQYKKIPDIKNTQNYNNNKIGFNNMNKEYYSKSQNNNLQSLSKSICEICNLPKSLDDCPQYYQNSHYNQTQECAENGNFEHNNQSDVRNQGKNKENESNINYGGDSQYRNSCLQEQPSYSRQTQESANKKYNTVKFKDLSNRLSSGMCAILNCNATPQKHLQKNFEHTCKKEENEIFSSKPPVICELCGRKEFKINGASECAHDNAEEWIENKNYCDICHSPVHALPVHERKCNCLMENAKFCAASFNERGNGFFNKKDTWCPHSRHYENADNQRVSKQKRCICQQSNHGLRNIPNKNNFIHKTFDEDFSCGQRVRFHQHRSLSLPSKNHYRNICRNANSTHSYNQDDYSSKRYPSMPIIKERNGLNDNQFRCISFEDEHRNNISNKICQNAFKDSGTATIPEEECICNSQKYENINVNCNGLLMPCSSAYKHNIQSNHFDHKCIKNTFQSRQCRNFFLDERNSPLHLDVYIAASNPKRRGNASYKNGHNPMCNCDKHNWSQKVMLPTFSEVHQCGKCSCCAPHHFENSDTYFETPATNENGQCLLNENSNEHEYVKKSKYKDYVAQFEKEKKDLLLTNKNSCTLLFARYAGNNVCQENQHNYNKQYAPRNVSSKDAVMEECTCEAQKQMETHMNTFKRMNTFVNRCDEILNDKKSTLKNNKCTQVAGIKKQTSQPVFQNALPKSESLSNLQNEIDSVESFLSPVTSSNLSAQLSDFQKGRTDQVLPYLNLDVLYKNYLFCWREPDVLESYCVDNTYEPHESKSESTDCFDRPQQK